MVAVNEPGTTTGSTPAAPEVRPPRLVDGFGRPKNRFAYVLADYIRNQTDSGAEMVDILLQIARDDVYRENDGERIRIPCRIPDRMGAIDRLMERGLGKVVQEVELISQDQSDLDARLEDMSVEEMESYLAKLDAIETDGETVT